MRMRDSLNVRKAMHWIRCFGLVVSDGPGTDITKYARIWDAFVCRLGCPEFTWPVDQPTPKVGSSRSLFIPDSAIYKGHPRFSTLTRNIRQRRGERVAINIPSKYTYIIYITFTFHNITFHVINYFYTHKYRKFHYNTHIYIHK